MLSLNSYILSHDSVIVSTKKNSHYITEYPYSSFNA